MTRGKTISRLLALIFILSGLMDLGLASISNPIFKSESKKKEFRILLNSNSIPVEGRFNRSKSGTEFEEESHIDADEVFFAHQTHFSFDDGRFVFQNKFTPTSFWPKSTPIFLLNRQLLV